MEVEKGPEVSAPETTDLKVPDKTQVRIITISLLTFGEIMLSTTGIQKSC